MLARSPVEVTARPHEAERTSRALSTTFQIDVNRVPEGRAPVADFALGVYSYTPRAAQWLVVHDAVNHRFVRYRMPVFERDGYEFGGLCRDGRQALLVATVASGAKRRLALLTLATGAVRWFDSDPETDGAGVLADVSADGRLIAVNSVVNTPPDANGAARWFDSDPETDGAGVLADVSADGRLIAVNSVVNTPPDANGEGDSAVAIGTVNTATGHYHRVWTSPPISSWGGGVAWSPDGRRLAVTYEPLGFDPEDQTVLLDLRGHVQEALPPEVSLAVPSRATWLTDAQLVLTDADGVGVVLDAATGGRRSLPTGHVVGRSGDQVVVDPGHESGEPTVLVAQPLNGGPARPWLTLLGSVMMRSLGFA